MFSAFFGHYLLNKRLVTAKQLKAALALQDKTHLKLGTLAINARYMTVAQVEEVHTMQLTCDLRFGDLAVGAGYLTSGQLKKLLGTQKSEHLLLAQSLVDLDVLTFDEFEAYLNAYKKAYELTDTAMEALKTDNAEAIVDMFFDLEPGPNYEFYKDYVTLFIKNQVRFINGHIRLGQITQIKKNNYDHLIGQTIKSDSNYYTAIAGPSKSLTKFASIYSEEKLSSFDEASIDAIGEYMNQNNGLFVVNKSNEGLENMTMTLQSHIEAPTLKPYQPLYDIPLHCSCGEIHLILGQL